MKKLIISFMLLLAFSINANAQDKNANTQQEKSTVNLNSAGGKQATELSEYLGLDQAAKESFAELFDFKFSILNDKKLPEEKRKELSRVIEEKLRGSLDAKQIEKLEKNPDLLKRLVN